MTARTTLERRSRSRTSRPALSEDLDQLLARIRACRVCEAYLPLGPRPVLQAGTGARILVVGQAPGARVHASGIPWDDPSGERLRKWMGITKEVFYDPEQIAIVPIGFCYPGRGAGGDNPPRPECAALWFEPLMERLPDIRLSLLIGQYAQKHCLGRLRRGSLTETVRAWREYAPDRFPLPHPSPRNQPWFVRHPWFEAELIPELRRRVAEVLLGDSSR